jgi:hypothetical protein
MAKRATLRSTQVNSEKWRKPHGKRPTQEFLVVRDSKGRFDGSRVNITPTIKGLLGK